MIKIVKGSDLINNIDLVCTYCGKEHNILRSMEGKDYIFERKYNEEWCICTKCQKECDKKGLK